MRFLVLKETGIAFDTVRGLVGQIRDQLGAEAGKIEHVHPRAGDEQQTFYFGFEKPSTASHIRGWLNRNGIDFDQRDDLPPGVTICAMNEALGVCVPLLSTDETLIDMVERLQRGFPPRF